ncbi:MAG TPA: excinuclease ABC subunit UvrA [Candidatus Fermentibacter daniensis]|nr:MAG: ABC-ATPase UvrA [Candidatus Fermentibacter daniensis]MBP7719303.1 excinuclease ABC subunit UvrA [Candidatus Fermentibacter sp.]HOA05397.1 excinuclease ABC subunit UvrA [Candidatus Fermentibacter daniensis]HOG55178.1 excinuclease ABC subunit UvrA [Candidatus Fermentibacter daniensis]
MDSIVVRGAREHNLRNIDVSIPRNRLVVVTGVSGSGKSSFAFDTLYAEGQRRYIESLSAYARQFLGQMEKPLYECIEGLSPAISIEQKTVSHNPRSTVGTVTEIADYLRVLFARIGEPHCPTCGRRVGRQSAQQIVDRISEMPEGRRLLIAAPIVRGRKGAYAELLSDLRKRGFVRVRIDGEVRSLDENIRLQEKRKHDIMVVVDRITVKPGMDTRLTSSVETALREGAGAIAVVDADSGEETFFSEQNACLYCGLSFPEPTVQLFSFNNPAGMCETCSGLGFEMKVDPDLVVPRPALSIKDGAVAPWGEPRGWSATLAKALAETYGFALGTPWISLDEEQRNAVLYGTGERRILKFQWEGGNSRGSMEGPWEGVIPRLERLYVSTSSEGSRINYERFFRKTPCSSCGGSRLRAEARSVLVSGRGIHELNSMTVQGVWDFFEKLELGRTDSLIAGELLKEIKGRLGFLMDVGLHYLTLDRSAPSLSGGEAQRIRLASQIGSSLTGVLYVLDEPTVGLHQRDNDKLINTLEKLRDLGNTVLVVEHDRDTILRADHVVDFGPGAGTDGGLVVAEGSPAAVKENPESLTGRYLTGKEQITRIRTPRSRSRGTLTLDGATLNNLRNVTVSFPLGRFICVTGVSGSGKSSLITQTLYPALSNLCGTGSNTPGPHRGIRGYENVDKVINISQDPIGRTPRSNPATYTKVFDQIRTIFAGLPAAKMRGYSPARFSFNVHGGRCEDCQGAGVKRIEMHFLPDVFVVCDTCGGMRFNKETLRVTFREHSIAQVLDLTVRQAMDLFERIPAVARTLKVMDDVGLGYIKLGQPATTLSGGEAQRVKLARELARPGATHTMYILDEPTTGLHFHDVRKLLQVLDRLVSQGNTVVVIEHNLDLVKNADWIIDLGPEGGDGGGMVIAEGTPDQVAGIEGSYTGRFLAEMLS